MTGNVSVNSIQGFVNTQGHTLNVGATPVNGVATGRVFATIAGDSGFLTAGQSAFAPNSAHPGELILNANVAASIIDNAGPDGIFNNDDDLPVSVVLLTGNLTNPNNRYTGGTTVLGRVRTQHPLPGPATLRDGALNLQAPAPGALMTNGALVADKPGGLVELEVGFASPPPISSSPAVRIEDLTVTRATSLRATAAFGSDPTSHLVVQGAVDLRGGSLSAGLLITFTGTYLDSADSRISEVFSSGSRLIRFQNSRLNDVSATLEIPLEADGTDTVVRFNGEMRSRNILRATNNGGIVVTAAGTITLRDRSDVYPLFLNGDRTGTIEFAEGFRLIRSVRDIETDLVGAPHIELQEPVRWITNHSDNLPNFTVEYMEHEAPDAYPGRIALAENGAVWQVQTNAQSFNQRLDIGASAHIVTNSSLVLTAESALAFGRVSSFDEPFGFALNKEGPADLTIAGRMTAIDQSIIDVRQGRLILNNRTAEGAGQVDVRVRSGAILAGGDADGTRGLIPGSLTVDAGGALNPGNASDAGALSLVGSFGALKLMPESMFQPTLAGATAGTLYDQVRVAGTVALGDGIAEHAVLAPSLSFAPQLGDLFFLIDNDGAEPISGLFETPGGAALTEGSFFDLTSSANGSAYRFEIGYRGDSAGGVFASPTGNDLVLRAVAIPEPASTALLLTVICIAVLGRVVLRHGSRSHRVAEVPRLRVRFGTVSAG
jgi:hypothetical protein